MNRQLTAAEAAILLQPNSRLGGKALKLFLLECAARGALTARREGWRKRGYVSFAPDGESRLPAAALCVSAWRALGGERYAGTEVPIKTLTDAARLAFGTDLNGFRETVLEGLIEAGLIGRSEKSVLRVFHYRSVEATALGVETTEHLKRLLDAFDASWRRRKTEPDDLATTVRQLGPLVLLAPKFRDQHREVDQALQMRPAADGSRDAFVYSYTTSDGGDLSFGSLDGFDFGGLDDALGVFDSGVGGDGGGSDGGDGGGGD